VRVCFFREMDNRVFIWTGYFTEQADIERYMRVLDITNLTEIDEEDDEIAISIFAEDIDLPIFDVAFQKYERIDSELALETQLTRLLGEASDVAVVAQKLKEAHRPSFNAILLIQAHEHTRYYRGTARPGSPISFLGVFEGKIIE